MQLTRTVAKLTHAAALSLLQHALAAAEAMKVPQCIAIVDEGCNLLAFARMDGARVTSEASARAKAMTAAVTGRPSGTNAPDRAVELAVATKGRMTNLPGGYPIVVDGAVVGGIGIGSGTGEEDARVARAALSALGLEVRT